MLDAPGAEWKGASRPRTDSETVRASPDSAYSWLARMPKTRIGLRGRLESFRGSPPGVARDSASEVTGPVGSETERKVVHGRDVASSGRRAAE